MYTILGFILILVTIISIYIKKQNKIENYFDIIPYDYHWNFFKCYTNDCVLKNSYLCYRYCNTLEEAGSRNNCRKRCFDYSDMQIEALKVPNRNFAGALGRFAPFGSTNMSRDDGIVL